MAAFIGLALRERVSLDTRKSVVLYDQNFVFNFALDRLPMSVCCARYMTGHRLGTGPEACTRNRGAVALGLRVGTFCYGTPVPAVVKGVRLHDLLHRSATLQLSAGVHFLQVSKWLGHSSFVLTLSTYADYIREDELAAPHFACPSKDTTNVVGLERKKNA